MYLIKIPDVLLRLKKKQSFLCRTSCSFNIFEKKKREGGNPFLHWQEAQPHLFAFLCMSRAQLICVFVHPFYRTPPLPSKFNLEKWTSYLLFPYCPAAGIWELLKRTSLYFSYLVTSEENIPPEPEMVYWQWLTANPDRPYKVFSQTGSCSVHIQAAVVFTMGQNETYLCLV